MTTILVDLDALADPRGREVIDGDWDAYHAAAKDDGPIGEVIILLFLIKAALRAGAIRGYRIVVVTDRPEKWRALTTHWLVDRGVMADEVLMRPAEDYGPGAEVKFRLAEAADDPVLVYIGTDEKTCAAFAAAGIAVLQRRAM